VIKYRGIYRVSSEIDSKGHICEGSFIPCKIGKRSQIYRYNDAKLRVWIESNTKSGNTSVCKRLINNYPHIFTVVVQGDTETILEFNELDIEQAAKILKVRVRGKKISPRSKKNLAFN
jgi:hypothetical protein